MGGYGDVVCFVCINQSSTIGMETIFRFVFCYFSNGWKIDRARQWAEENGESFENCTMKSKCVCGDCVQLQLLLGAVPVRWLYSIFVLSSLVAVVQLNNFWILFFSLLHSEIQVYFSICLQILFFLSHSCKQMTIASWSHLFDRVFVCWCCCCFCPKKKNPNTTKIVCKINQCKKESPKQRDENDENENNKMWHNLNTFRTFIVDLTKKKTGEQQQQHLKNCTCCCCTDRLKKRAGE